jgi:hypothetical protein
MSDVNEVITRVHRESVQFRSDAATDLEGRTSPGGN